MLFIRWTIFILSTCMNPQPQFRDFVRKLLSNYSDLTKNANLWYHINNQRNGLEKQRKAQLWHHTALLLSLVTSLRIQYFKQERQQIQQSKEKLKPTPYSCVLFDNYTSFFSTFILSPACGQRLIAATQFDIKHSKNTGGYKLTKNIQQESNNFPSNS